MRSWTSDAYRDVIYFEMKTENRIFTYFSMCNLTASVDLSLNIDDSIFGR